METKLPDRAQVVIAGSGMIGNSVAFHLTQVRLMFVGHIFVYVVNQLDSVEFCEMNWLNESLSMNVF
jgi:hypothetical protein